MAILFTVSAFALSVVLYPFIGETKFLLFFISLTLSAWIGGVRPGILAAALSIFCVDFFLDEPRYQLFDDPVQSINFLMFFVVAALISWLEQRRLDRERELRDARNQLARLYEQSQELTAIEERQRLARELHDSVNQTLFTISALAESAIRRWDTDRNRAYDLLKQSHALTVTALAEMRVLMLELRSASLAKIEFKQLLIQFVDSFKSRGTFSIDARIDDVPPLPPQVQIGLYRIVQEAFNNIFKHSGATQAELLVINTPTTLELTIRDNGCGFEVDNAHQTDGLGIGIMRERARDIRANCAIDSALEQGTTISVVWRKPTSVTQTEAVNQANKVNEANNDI